jgi:outer membrane biogenesis lipoprotein LolB
MKKFSRAIALLLVGGMLLSGCSMLTAQGRRERAYERYVHKSSQGRVKQQKRFAAKGNTMPVMHPSEPVETTDVSGPESVSDGSEQ